MVKKLKKLTGKKLYMYEALSSTLSNISEAVKLVNARNVMITRQAHYYWIEHDPNYKLWIENLEEEKKDFGENILMKLVREGNPKVVMFFNERYNKDKYSKKEEIEHSGDFGVSINLIEKSNEEILKEKHDKSINKQ